MSSSGATNGRDVIARNVRAARGEERQRDLAARLGVDPMRVSDWERGEHVPSMGNLAALAMATGRDMAWFYTDHDASAAA